MKKLILGHELCGSPEPVVASSNYTNLYLDGDIFVGIPVDHADLDLNTIKHKVHGIRIGVMRDTNGDFVIWKEREF